MKNSLLLFCILSLYFAVACDRTSKPLPASQTSAQHHTANLKIECDGVCLSQAGVLTVKTGAKSVLCTAIVAGSQNSVLVQNDCVATILKSGGGCLNKVAFRLPQSKQVFTCAGISQAGNELSYVHLKESLPVNSMVQDSSALVQSSQILRVGFRLEGKKLVQESKPCQVVHGSLLNPSTLKNPVALLHGCANTDGMKSAGLINQQGVLLNLVDDQSATILKNQRTKLSVYQNQTDLANLSVTHAIPGHNEKVVTLDSNQAVPALRLQLISELAKIDDHFQWKPEIINISAYGKVTTLVPSCLKEKVFSDLNEKRWRGLSRAATGGVVKLLALPVWQMTQQMDSVGHPVLVLEPQTNLPVLAEMTKPSVDNTSAVIGLVLKGTTAPMWSKIISKCD